MKILLSIRPEYAELILSGIKKYEFRHRLASHDIDSILLYATAPVKKIIGEVEVIGTLSATPTNLWEETKSTAGITRALYQKYFYGHKIANAYILGKVTPYNPPKPTETFGVLKAPQSFVYIP